MTGRQRWEARAAEAVRRLLRILPRRAALALGASLGRVVADLDRRHVAIASDNLRHAFPHWDEGRRLRTAADVYAHFGRVLFDVLWLHGRRAEEVLRLTEVEGREHVEAAMAAGRGAVLVTGHLGNWEVHGVGHGLLFGPIGVVARPLDNPALDRRLCEARTGGGNTVIPKRHALAHVLRSLRSGKAVAVLIDQNVHEADGVFVEFFGRRAATTTVAAALAVKTGCALVPSYTRLLPGGRYRFVYEPPLFAAPGERLREVERLTQALTRRIEAWVSAQPEQWLWMHRRWKTQPAGEAPPAAERQAAAVPAGSR